MCYWIVSVPNQKSNFHLEFPCKVLFFVYSYHRNLTESTNIYIGTVPLSTYQLPQPPARGTDYHTKPAEAAQGMYPTIPSPSAPEEPTDNFNPQGSSLYPNLGNYVALINIFILTFHYFLSQLYSFVIVAPPSYEESMFGARTLRDREESEHVIGGGDKFAPRYPVYNFKSSE